MLRGPETNMKITFLGTSHGLAEKNRFMSSALVESNGCSYLVDAGAPADSLMVNMDKSFFKLKSVFITHMHADHVMNLTTLAIPLLMFKEDDRNKSLYFPTFEGRVAYLTWMEALHNNMKYLAENIDMKVTSKGKIYEDENLTVSAVPTRHFPPDWSSVKSWGYVFEENGKRVLFTGDLSGNFPEYPEMVKDQHFDLVVCEMAHSNLCDVEDILKNTSTEKMVITHYHMPKLGDYPSVFETFPFPVRLVHDGEVIEL